MQTVPAKADNKHSQILLHVPAPAPMHVSLHDPLPTLHTPGYECIEEGIEHNHANRHQEGILHAFTAIAANVAPLQPHPLCLVQGDQR